MVWPGAPDRALAHSRRSPCALRRRLSAEGGAAPGRTPSRPRWSHSPGSDWNDLSLAKPEHRVEVVGPYLERGALLHRIGGAVVDTRDAGLRTPRDVVDQRLDHVRGDPQLVHPGHHRAAQVVER